MTNTLNLRFSTTFLLFVYFTSILMSCKKPDNTVPNGGPSSAFINKAVNDTIYLTKPHSVLDVLSNDIHNASTRIYYGNLYDDHVIAQSTELIYNYDSLVVFPELIAYGSDTLEYSIYQDIFGLNGQTSKAKIFLHVGNEAQFKTGNIIKYLLNSSNHLFSVNGDTSYHFTNHSAGSLEVIKRASINLDAPVPGMRNYYNGLNNGRIRYDGSLEFDDAVTPSLTYVVKVYGLFNVDAIVNGKQESIEVIRLGFKGQVVDYKVWIY